MALGKVRNLFSLCLPLNKVGVGRVYSRGAWGADLRGVCADLPMSVVCGTNNSFMPINFTHKMKEANFLKNAIYQKLKWEQKEDLNGPFSVKDIKFVLKIFHTKKTLGSDGSTGFYQTFKAPNWYVPSPRKKCVINNKLCSAVEGKALSPSCSGTLVELLSLWCLRVTMYKVLKTYSIYYYKEGKVISSTEVCTGLYAYILVAMYTACPPNTLTVQISDVMWNGFGGWQRYCV